jgi:hypothetical protein
MATQGDAHASLPGRRHRVFEGEAEGLDMKASVPKVALLAGVLVLAAGGLGWRLARARPQAAKVTASEESATADELAALRRQVQALQDAQSRTRYQVETALGSKEAAAQDPAKKEDPEPATPEELRKRDYDRSKHVADYVQRILDDESTDLTWAPTRIQEIKDSFKEMKLPGFAFKDAECRSTLCRVTVSRAPEGITQELGTAMMQLEPFKRMGAFFHYEDDHVVMYSPREGHDFPKDPALARR